MQLSYSLVLDSIPPSSFPPSIPPSLPTLLSPSSIFCFLSFFFPSSLFPFCGHTWQCSWLYDHRSLLDRSLSDYIWSGYQTTQKSEKKAPFAIFYLSDPQFISDKNSPSNLNYLGKQWWIFSILIISIRIEEMVVPKFTQLFEFTDWSFSVV